MTFLFFTHTTLVNFFTIIGFSGILVAGALLLLQGAAFAAHLFTKKQLDTWDAVGLYVLIGLVFLATAITHPEYMPYLDGTMSSGKYEVLDSVFRFGRGIYAYYVSINIGQKSCSVCSKRLRHVCFSISAAFLPWIPVTVWDLDIIWR